MAETSQRKRGRPARGDDKLISLTVRVTPEQKSWLNGRRDKGELFRRLLSAAMADTTTDATQQ